MISAQGMAGHLIRRLHQQSVQVFQQRMQAAGFDLTPVQFAALDAVAAEPGMDQATLAARIAYDRATIGGVVDRLVTKGLLHRTVSRADRRARVLALTAEGAAQLAAATPVVLALQAAILGPLDPGEGAALLALVEKALGGAP